MEIAANIKVNYKDGKLFISFTDIQNKTNGLYPKFFVYGGDTFRNPRITMENTIEYTGLMDSKLILENI